MKYIVIELQESADGKVSNIVTSHDTANAAESKYHAVLSAAAVSSVLVHSAIMVNSHGGYIDSKSFNHGETE